MDGANETDLMVRRLEVARQITKLYSLERYVYIGFCCVSIALLILAAWKIVTPYSNPELGKPQIDVTLITTILGSGGMFATSLGLLMFQWNKIVDLILARDSSKEE